MPTLSKKQLEQRRHAIMASDVPTLLGLNQFQSPLELSYKKLDRTEIVRQEPPSLSMEIGHLVEPISNKLYKKESGNKTTLNKYSFFAGGDQCHHGATPDGFIIRDGEEWNDHDLLELKYSTRGQDWGKLPDHVFCQVQWQMHVLKREVCDVAALVAWRGTNLKLFTVHRDQNFIDEVIKLVDEFWKSIKSGHLPVASGTVSEVETLNKVFDREAKTIAPFESDDVGLIELLDKSQEVADEKREIAQRERQHKNNVKAYMGHHPKMMAGNYKVTWKRPADKVIIDWAKAWDDLAGSLENIYPKNDVVMNLMQNAIEGNTTTKKQNRRMNIFRFDEEE